MTVLPFGDIGVRPGVWSMYRIYAGAPDVVFSCPSCGYPGVVDPRYIAASGHITTTLVCPSRGACTWARSEVILEGWSPMRAINL